MKQVQVQLRVPKTMAAELDRWVRQGRFASRSDAIKTILSLYEERQHTRQFARMLYQRSKEARENPAKLVLLDA